MILMEVFPANFAFLAIRRLCDAFFAQVETHGPMADHPVLQQDGQFGSFWPKHGNYTTIHWFPRVLDVENPWFP